MSTAFVSAAVFGHTALGTSAATGLKETMAKHVAKSVAASSAGASRRTIGKQPSAPRSAAAKSKAAAGPKRPPKTVVGAESEVATEKKSKLTVQAKPGAVLQCEACDALSTATRRAHVLSPPPRLAHKLCVNQQGQKMCPTPPFRKCRICFFGRVP